LEAAREKYAKKNKVISEDDFPTSLQRRILKSTPQVSRTPTNKVRMGYDYREKRVEQPRHVLDDYYYTTSEEGSNKSRHQVQGDSW
jgi:hypothetical protein